MLGIVAHKYPGRAGALCCRCAPHRPPPSGCCAATTGMCLLRSTMMRRRSSGSRAAATASSAAATRPMRRERRPRSAGSAAQRDSDLFNAASSQLLCGRLSHVGAHGKERQVGVKAQRTGCGVEAPRGWAGTAAIDIDARGTSLHMSREARLQFGSSCWLRQGKCSQLLMPNRLSSGRPRGQRDSKRV